MPLLEESDGSGACAKIIFLVLLSSLGLAVGVIFFEMGGINSIKGFAGFGDVEQTINVPDAQLESPVVPLAVDDFIDDPIEPSPLQKGFSPIESMNSVINYSFLVLNVHSIDSTKDIEIDVIQEAVEEAKEQISYEEVPEAIVAEQSEQAVTEPVVEVAEHLENEVTEENLVEPELVVGATENVPEPVIPSTETVSEVVEESRPLEVSENFEAQLEDDPVEVPQGMILIGRQRNAFVNCILTILQSRLR